MAYIDVKEIIVKPINSTKANEFVRKHHYSGKVVNNSCLHFGAFYKDILHGVLSFGPSMDKSKIIGLVKDTKWNDFLELNRMAFDDYLPKNSESRCIAVSFKLIKKHYPNIKWVISFADGTQCGDGAIYRASGFSLCGITENKTILEFPNGERYANMSLRPQCCSLEKLKYLYDVVNLKWGGGISYRQRVGRTRGQACIGLYASIYLFSRQSIQRKINCSYSAIFRNRQNRCGNV